MIDSIIKFIANPQYNQKILAYIIIILCVFLFKSVLPIMLATFLFAYLFLLAGKNINKLIHIFTNKYIKNKNLNSIIKYLFSVNIIVTGLYIGFILIFAFAISDFLPQIINELNEIPKKVPFIAEYIREITPKLKELNEVNDTIQGGIIQLTAEKDLNLLIKIIDNIKRIGSFIFKLFLSLILSYFFIIDRKKIRASLEAIQNGYLKHMYKEFSMIFGKIIKSFGLVFKAQSIIAFINASLTIVGLIIIGTTFNIVFPYLLTLTIFVFICSFIPIFGVIISSVPISIIGYTIGGIQAVGMILIMICLIHILEAYFINPKIIGSYIHLPISITFLLLILSEMTFGIMGLLIGIPISYIIIDIFKSINKKTSLS